MERRNEAQKKTVKKERKKERKRPDKRRKLNTYTVNDRNNKQK